MAGIRELARAAENELTRGENGERHFPPKSSVLISRHGRADDGSS